MRAFLLETITVTRTIAFKGFSLKSYHTRSVFLRLVLLEAFPARASAFRFVDF